MADSGETLEQRFAEMAQALAAAAGQYMDAESYGQWAEAPYEAAQAATEKTGGGHQAMPQAKTAMPMPAANGGMPSMQPVMAQPAMKPPAAGMADTLLPYFMSQPPAMETGQMRTSAATRMPASEHANVLDRVYGLDMLDAAFIGEMANRMFREVSSAPRAPAIPGMDKTGMEQVPSYGSLPYFMEASKGQAASGRIRSVLDVESIRRDFPILQRKVHGKPLVWLDNGATTQKPQSVIDRVAHYYSHENSNIHRAAHKLAAESTDAYEAARSKVAAFLGAASPEEIVFVRGTTEGLNLLASVCAMKSLSPGDEILLTEAEHHANIVPWQFAAQKTGAVIRVAPVDDRGELILEEYRRLLGPRTKVVSITHVSNVLGTVMPIDEMTRMAKSRGAIVIIDGAQGVPHRRVNVQATGCDFYVFSGHKLFGPTGIGAIYGRKEMWDNMEPWQGGGNMIQHVTFERSIFAPAPAKFEAGTASLASAVGLGAAIDYLQGIGIEAIEQYETQLLDYALDGILRVKGLRVIGMPRERGGVISFVMKGLPDMEVGKLLDAEGIAVRAGHHCAQPVLAHFGLQSSVRPAFAFYNTRDEADALVAALHKISQRI